jgi:cytoskeletal protein CcmA (bactofilin family)
LDKKDLLAYSCFFKTEQGGAYGRREPAYGFRGLSWSHFDGPTTIDGEVEGEIIAQANITIGQQATVKGKISAAAVVIQGKVLADIQADKKIEVQPPGSIVGDVTTQSLVIGDGAVLEGHVSMKKTEGRVLPLRQEAKPIAKEGTSS